MWRTTIFCTLLITLPASAQTNKLPTKDDVLAWKAKYQAERDRLVQEGLAPRFLPGLLEHAEAMAQRGDKALQANTLLQALEAFRQARWQLPYPSPQVPKEHVAKVLGSFRLRHGLDIRCLAFSPDGQQLLTGSLDGTVKIWNLENGHELRTFTANKGYIRAVAFSPDGKQVAAGGGDKDIQVWDAHTGQEVHTLPGQAAYINSLLFSHDGKFLVAAQGNDSETRSTLAIYDVASGALKRVVNDFKFAVRSLAFDRTGALLAVGSDDGQTRLYEFPKIAEQADQSFYWAKQDDQESVYQLAISPDLQWLVRCGATGIKIYDLVQPGKPFQVAPPRRHISAPSPKIFFVDVLFSKDGTKLYAAGTDGVIREFDPVTGNLNRTLRGHHGPVTALALSPTGSVMASASSDFTVRFWEFDIVVHSRDLTGHEGPVWKSAFSADGLRVVSASADRSVRIWDAVSAKLLQTLPGHKAPATAALFTPDGRHVVSAGGDKLLHVWDANSGALVKTLEGHQATVTCLALTGDGQTIVSGGADRRVIVWDAKTYARRHSLEIDALVASVAVSADHKTLAIGATDQSISLWSLDKGQRQAVWSGHGISVNSLAFSVDGKYLASGGGDQLVRVWPLASPGLNPITLTGHVGPVSSVAFRKDGQHVLSAGSDRNIKLWRLDAGSGKELQNYMGHTDWITSVAFHPEGTYFLSSGVDKLIKLWEVTNREIPFLSEHFGQVRTVAVSPDGKLIASGSTDKAIKIWDRTTGAEIRTLFGHNDAISALVFAPDNKTLISTSRDQTIRLWNLETGLEIPRSALQQQNWTGFFSEILLLGLAPDGKKLFAWEPGSSGGKSFAKINAYELDGKQLFTFNDAGRDIVAVAFSPECKFVVTAAKDGSVQTFDLEKTGQAAAGGAWYPFEKDSGTGDIALTADAKLLIASNGKGDVRITSLADKKEIRTLKAHAGSISVVQLSPDSKRFATLGGDSWLKVWDVATGEVIRSWDLRLAPELQGRFVRQVAFTPDGKHLVTANANSTLFVLECP